MKKYLAAAGLWILIASASHAQTLVGYWDLNSNQSRSSGSSGLLSAELEGYGITYIGYGTGTTVNLEPGFSAGESLSFVNLASIIEVGHVTVSGLNFTGLVAPTFSFAARSNPAFQLGDVFKLEYNTGSGWTLETTLPTPNTSYAMVTRTFSSGILDGLPNVDIRITFSTVVAVADTFEVDNVKVTAVPEPASLALFGLGGALMLFRLHRKPDRHS